MCKTVRLLARSKIVQKSNCFVQVFFKSYKNVCKVDRLLATSKVSGFLIEMVLGCAGGGVC